MTQSRFLILLVATVGWLGGPWSRAQEPAAAPPAVTPPADTAIQTRCLGVAVVREVVETDAQSYKPFGMDVGTRLSLAFRTDGPAALVCFDAEASRLDSFIDDLSTNLLALSHRLQSPGFVPYACGTLGAGNQAYVEILGGTAPTAGATRVLARGTAVFRVGSRKEQAVSPVTQLKVGETFLLGDRFQFPVTRVEKGGLGSKSAKVSLSFTGDSYQIASARFLDGNGAALDARSAGWRRDGRGDAARSEFNFIFDPVPAECAIEIVFWADMKAVALPFSVESGIGG